MPKEGQQRFWWKEEMARLFLPEQGSLAPGHTLEPHGSLI